MLAVVTSITLRVNVSTGGTEHNLSALPETAVLTLTANSTRNQIQAS